MKKFVLASLAVGLLAITGCEELENLCGISEEDLGFTEDYTKHLNAAIYIYQISDLALRDSTLEANQSAMIHKANCTRTPDSLFIDFGNGTEYQGVTRYGSIRMAYTGDYRDPGSSSTIVLRDYREGDQTYEGMVSLNNVTTGSNPIIDVLVSELKVDSLSMGGNVNAEWLTGFETETVETDDAFQLTGGLTLTNTNSMDNFAGTITNPLLIENSCDVKFVSGIVDLVPSNTKYPQLSMDFIDGDCADLFTATLNCEGNNLSFSYPIQ